MNPPALIPPRPLPAKEPPSVGVCVLCEWPVSAASVKAVEDGLCDHLRTHFPLLRPM